MNKNALPDRRSVLKAAAGGAVGVLAVPLAAHAAEDFGTYRPKGRLKQSVCRWCYGSIPLEQLADAASRMGMKSVELLSPEEYPTVKKYGLTCAMVKCRSIPDGLNRKENHGWIEKELRRHIEFAADEGLPNVICMSGNRRGMSDEEGLKNCAIGLKRVLGLAEKKKVTVCMEGLNSKVDHHDYMYDHTRLGRAPGEKAWLAPIQASVRHLPHADHGR